MESWQIDLLKYGATAVVAGIGGIFGYWTWTRKQRTEADVREHERQAEYEEFKRRRNLVGAGELERIGRADKLTDLLIKLKQHQISPEEFYVAREQLVMGRKRKLPTIIGESYLTSGNASDSGELFHTNIVEKIVERIVNPPIRDWFMQEAPFDERLTAEQRQLLAAHLLGVLDDKGPNGFPVGFLHNGDKVEWIKTEEDEQEAGAEPPSPMILLRNEEDIHAASEECFDKIWWNRHRLWLHRIESGDEKLTDQQKPIFAKAVSEAKRIEDKYGVDKLKVDDFEWGMINGKLSALRWVTGAEWDSLDT